MSMDSLLKKYSKNVLATDTSISMLKKGKKYIEKKYNSKGISFFGGDILKEKYHKNLPMIYFLFQV